MADVVNRRIEEAMRAASEARGRAVELGLEGTVRDLDRVIDILHEVEGRLEDNSGQG